MSSISDYKVTRNHYKPFNKAELMEKIKKMSITKEGTNVVTRYGERVISTVQVSKIYEIFDIKSYMIEKIDQIAKNFNISYYHWEPGAVQQLTLLSDIITINGKKYYKSFFILNSSNKVRRLSINLGLYHADTNTYFSSKIDNMHLSKKHYIGITDKAEDVSKAITSESFEQQIEALTSLVGQKVLLSNLQKIILVTKDVETTAGVKQEITKSSHQAFDNFKNKLLGSVDALQDVTKDQRNTLKTSSETLRFNVKNDILIDAFKAMHCYMMCFSDKDAHTIVKESERIMKMTQYFIRQEKINKLIN